LPAAKKQAVDQTPDSYVRGLQVLNELVYSQMNAKILPQPIETIVNRDRTDIRFAGGSKRLAVGDQLDDAAHDSDDVIHMNDEFGKLWLKSLFADLPPS